jgi:hypothetical protein
MSDVYAVEVAFSTSQGMLVGPVGQHLITPVSTSDSLRKTTLRFFPKHLRDFSAARNERHGGSQPPKRLNSGKCCDSHR